MPGSVLVVDDVAYFAAGRQPLADGGIRFFSVDPGTGYVRWISNLDSVPQKGFYRSSGLEFDNFDLLFREGESIAMSRWKFNRDTGKMSVDAKETFSRLNTGGRSVAGPAGKLVLCPPSPESDDDAHATSLPRGVSGQGLARLSPG